MEAHEQRPEIEVFVTRMSKKVIHNNYDPYFDSFAASTTIEQLKEVLRNYYSHGTLLQISAFSLFYKDIEVQDSEPIHKFEQNGWVQLELRIKDDSTPRRPPEILPTSFTTCCTRGLEAPERVYQLPESEATLTCKIINLEINQMNEEFVHHDVMEYIWKYLDVKDLNNMLQVSTSWRNAALPEKNKRFCIQQLRLPYKFSNLDDMLYVNPYVSLLICDSKLEKSLGLNNNLKEKLVEKSLYKVIVLEVKKCLSTQDPEFESVEDQGGNELTSNCDLLGLFFQSTPQQGRVYVACTSSIFLGYLNEFSDTDQLAEELGLYDCEYSKSTLLLFVGADDFDTNFIVNELVCRAKAWNSKEAIWYNANSIELSEALNFHGENHRRISQEKQQIVAIRITGPSVESWTIEVNLLNRRGLIERMLHAFKRKITFKRHSIALFSAPHDISPSGNSHDIIRSMKRMFPGITVVGLFHDQRKFSANTLVNQKFILKDGSISNKLSTSSVHPDVFLSLIVITYN